MHTKSYNLLSLPILLTFQNANRAYLATAICSATSYATVTSYCQSINDPHCKCCLANAKNRQQLRQATARFLRVRSGTARRKAISRHCDYFIILISVVLFIIDLDLFCREQRLPSTISDCTSVSWLRSTTRFRFATVFLILTRLHQTALRNHHHHYYH